MHPFMAAELPSFDLARSLEIGLFPLVVEVPHPERNAPPYAALYFQQEVQAFRSLCPRGPLDRVAEMEGPALEGLIAQHLRAWVAYRGDDLELYFWRKRSGVEVDFVLYGEGGFWAIEVKNSRSIRPADLRGLRAFATDYPECRTLLLYRGNQSRETNGVLCVPVEQFLKQLRPERGLIDGLGEMSGFADSGKPEDLSIDMEVQ
jgi:hypothetical protein